MRRLLSLLLGLTALACTLGAQPATEPPRQIRFLAWEAVDGELTLGSGPRATPLRLSTTQLGPLIDLPPGVERLFRQGPGPAGQPVPLPFAQLPPWPAGETRAIALVVPGARQGDYPARIVLLPDSESVHPEHSVRILNLTPIALALRAGSAQAVVEPRGELVGRYDPAAGRLRLDLAARSDGEWRRILARNLPAPAGHRLLVLLRPPANDEPGAENNQPGLLIISDRVAQPIGPRTPLPRSDAEDAI